MKFFPFLFFTCIALFGCSKNSSGPSPEALSIQRVNSEYKQAISNSVMTVERHQTLSLKKLNEELLSIKTSDCPKDFRMAWVDFTEAVKERSMIHGDTGELIALFAHPVTGLTEANQKAQESQQAEIKILRARAQLAKIGIKYGAF